MQLKQQSASWYDGEIMKTLNIHKYSNIIDITIDYNSIYLYYTIEHDFNKMKEVFIRIIKIPLASAASFENTISENYKFLKQIDIYDQVTSVNSSDNSHTINNDLYKTSYLIFIDENKQTDELRDEQINNVLGNDV